MKPLNTDEIILSVVTVTNGARQMISALPVIVESTDTNHRSIHTVSPAEAERLRAADATMADVLDELATVARDAAQTVRASIGEGKEN